jgi:hypothetical protein
MGESKIRQMAKAPIVGDGPKFKDAIGNVIEEGDVLVWMVGTAKYKARVLKARQPLVLADGTIEKGSLSLQLDFTKVVPPKDAKGRYTDVEINDMIVSRDPDAVPEGAILQ